MIEKIHSMVKEFIENQFLVEFDDEVDDTANLFKLGLIDSFGFLELVTFLEKTFQIRIHDNELVSNELTSLTNIVQCVSRKIPA